MNLSEIELRRIQARVRASRELTRLLSRFIDFLFSLHDDEACVGTSKYARGERRLAMANAADSHALMMRGGPRHPRNRKR